MHIHFDGDLLVYRAGFAAEKQEWWVVDDGGGVEATFMSKKEALECAAECNEWPDDQRCFEVSKGDRKLEPVENALHNVRTLVDKALENLAADKSSMTMYLSGPTNFREGIATLRPYKGNRDPDHKPVHGPAIKEFMEKNYDVVYSEDEEADDVVGYSHYRMFCQDPHSSIIATVDKDLDMIPGMHYNFVKDESYYVDEERAIRWFYMQLLMGDSTDNIPGIPRVGPAKAAKMLADAETEWELYSVAKAAYMEAYADVGTDSPEENAMNALVENAQLLWIRRHPNEWWLPPQDADDVRY